MEKRYTDYFPLRNQGGIKGAYDFLVTNGHKDVVDAVWNLQTNPNGRRLSIVGCLYRLGLIDDFLKFIWVQGSMEHRRALLLIWKRRYDKRPELHVLS